MSNKNFIKKRQEDFKKSIESEIDRAKRLIEDKKKNDLVEAGKAIDEICKKYNVQLIPIGKFEGQSFQSDVVLINN